MRHSVGIVASLALAFVLAGNAALADSPAIHQAQFDLASQLMLRWFGETSDSTASFSAQQGDRSSESPLRELAFRVPANSATESSNQAQPGAVEHLALTSLSDVGASYLSRAADAGVLSTGLQLQPAARPHEPDVLSLDENNALYTAAYQPVAPLPNISPAPGTLAFVSAAAASETSGTPTTLPSFDSAAQSATHPLNLNLSGGYQPVTSWQLPGDNPPSVPNLAGSNQLSLRAGVGVAVYHGLSLNFNYDTQRTYGAGMLPGLESLDAANNSYIAGLTYHLPSSSKTLSISAYQSVLPASGYTQTGEDVNFTVKF